MTNTTLIGTAVGALALGSLVTAQFKTSSADASRSATALESRAGGAEVASAGPVLVNCGEGRRALVRQASYGGQRAAQVECVDAAALPMAVDAWGQPLVGRGLATPVLANYTTPVYSAPAVRAPVRTQTVYRRSAPTYRTASVSRHPTTQVRSWKKSALIIGGSAAGGAAVGAVLDGKSGAKKGAVLGGVAGTVYDIATRTKTR